MLYGDRMNSNALLYNQRTMSNAVSYGLRISSNTLLYLIDNVSDAILYLVVSLKNNSDALVHLSDTVRTDSNAFASGIQNNSNAINQFYNNLVAPAAGSVDGTQFVKYCAAHHVFHPGASAVRGWVRFNDGFTVLPQATVLMDTLTTVSGAIDLRDSGLLSLNNDLYLAHNVTLTSGGSIKGRSSVTGQANTIFMGGDLTLAADDYLRTLRITGDWSNSGTSGDLIIDGCGHTLNIGDRATDFCG